MAYKRKLDDFMISDRVLIKNFPEYKDLVDTTIRKYDHKKISKKIATGELVYGKVVGFRELTKRVMVWVEDTKHGKYIGFRKKDIKLEERFVGEIDFSHVDPIVKEAYEIAYGK